MKYKLEENQGEKWGVVSNLHCFLNRHLDGGFKTKWSGFWVPPYKFLDYYAVRVNGYWLNSETLESTEYGDEMVFHHDTGSLEIHERISAPGGLPGLRIELEIDNMESDRKAVHVNIEPAVDIRRKDIDMDGSDYRIEKDSGRIMVERSGRKLVIEGDPDMKVEGEKQKKEHFPSGDRQEALIPGELGFREEIEPQGSAEIGIEMRTSDGNLGEIETLDQGFENEELGQAFRESIESMENLVYGHNGKGIIAGHPWFQTYWARDSFWTLLGMIDAGHLELSHEILENFASHDGFPNRINLDGEPDASPNADAAPLFVIAADKLERHHETSDLIKEKQEEAFEHLEHENGVVQHDPAGTWMDTQERAPAVDIQSLWLEAARVMDHELEGELESGLREFEQDGHVKDYLGDNPPLTVNPAVPLMFGHFKEEHAYDYLEEINGEYTSRYGARTRSMTDMGYDSSGYHTGSVWELTSGWVAAGNLRYGKHGQGINMLEKMAEFLGRNQPGALPEVVDAEEGTLLGCGEQAWSAGMMVHVIDSYLLGIQAKESHVEIDPVPGISCRRTGKKLKGEELDLEIVNGEVEILNDPDLELILW